MSAYVQISHNVSNTFTNDQKKCNEKLFGQKIIETGHLTKFSKTAIC